MNHVPVIDTSRPVDGLPDGLSARPLVPEDALPFFELHAEGELADTGEVAIELADIESDWARPSLDLARHTMGVWDGDLLVAGCDVYRTRRAEGAVRPSHRGRGIGTALARWTQECSARDGGTVVGMTVPEGSAGEAVLRGLGYRTGWTSWVLRLPGDAVVPERPLPDGFTLRDATTEELPVVHEVIEDAFNEWPDRQPSPFEDWAASVPRRSGFEPWQLRVVLSPSGEVVGVSAALLAGEGEATTAYVGQLATRADHRGRGLGQALLADAFALGRTHGARVSELSTDSRTGALPLYQRLGMVVTQTWRHWQVDVA